MKQKTTKIVRVLCLFLALIFVISGCGKSEEKPAGTSAESEEITADDNVNADSGNRSLLTNEPSDKDLSKVRPVAVMIENTKAGLPHYGLCEAGIVYEMPEEGGITRYMALYDEYEDFDRLGNIRSTRPYYVQVAAEYHAIIAHIGQSIYAEVLLKSMSPNSGICDDVNGILGNTSYIRTNDKKAPHNTYLTSKNLIKDIEANGYNREYDEPRTGTHFQFSKDENLLEDGDDVSKASIYFYHNKPYFTYDEKTKLYTKFEFGKQETDNYSKDGITFTNLIIQEVDSNTHSNDPYIDVHVIGSGKGKFLTRGKMVDITWSKADPFEKTYYFMPDGSEIELNTGKTYIAIAENAGKDKNSYEK